MAREMEEFPNQHFLLNLSFILVSGNYRPCPETYQLFLFHLTAEFFDQ